MRCPSVCLSVCLSPKCVHKNAIFSKTNLELWSLLTTYRKYYGLFEEPINGPLKIKMADRRHFKNCFFGHKSAASRPISLKFCVREQFFFQRILVMGHDTRVPENEFFVFLVQFWSSTSGSFRIVSDTLYYYFCY